MRKYVFIILVILFFGCKKKNDDHLEEEAINRKFSAKMAVEVCSSINGTLTKYIYTNGTVKAKNKASIILETAGRLDSLFVTENERVKKGMILAKLDVEDAQLQLESLDIDIEQKQTELKAFVAVEGEKKRSKIAQRIGLKQLELQKKQLQLSIEKATIKAPMNGVVCDLDNSIGEYLNGGTGFCKIFNLSEMFIDVPILESEIGKVENDAKAIIQVASKKESLYEGKVISISPKINTQSRACMVRVSLENDGFLKDGMFADLKIATENLENQVIIPKDALLVRDGKTLIFTVEDGKAKWKYVKLNDENKYFTSVKNGVAADEKVVIVGNFALSHDADVKVKKTHDYEILNQKF